MNVDSDIRLVSQADLKELMAPATEFLKEDPQKADSLLKMASGFVCEFWDTTEAGQRTPARFFYRLAQDIDAKIKFHNPDHPNLEPIIDSYTTPLILIAAGITPLDSPADGDIYEAGLRLSNRPEILDQYYPLAKSIKNNLEIFCPIKTVESAEKVEQYSETVEFNPDQFLNTAVRYFQGDKKDAWIQQLRVGFQKRLNALFGEGDDIDLYFNHRFDRVSFCRALSILGTDILDGAAVLEKQKVAPEFLAQTYQVASEFFQKALSETFPGTLDEGVLCGYYINSLHVYTLRSGIGLEQDSWMEDKRQSIWDANVRVIFFKNHLLHLQGYELAKRLGRYPDPEKEEVVDEREVADLILIYGFPNTPAWVKAVGAHLKLREGFIKVDKEELKQLDPSDEIISKNSQTILFLQTAEMQAGELLAKLSKTAT